MWTAPLQVALTGPSTYRLAKSDQAVTFTRAIVRVTIPVLTMARIVGQRGTGVRGIRRSLPRRTLPVWGELLGLIMPLQSTDLAFAIPHCCCGHWPVSMSLPGFLILTKAAARLQRNLVPMLEIGSFQVFTAVTMKNTIFRDIKPSSHHT
jgi:hypothetical protein